MGLRIVYGRAGTGKSEFCFNEISNRINTDKNIYVITPEQFSFTAEKKLMECINTGAVVNAEVITFNRMAYRVLNEIGGKNTTNLSKAGKAMLMYSILLNNRKNLKFLGKTDENVDLAITAITEFKKHGIQCEQLQNELQNTEDIYLKTKLQDMSLIYESFEQYINNKYIDETDLLTILANNIEKLNMFKESIIYIDEFAGYTSQEYDIITKLLKIAKEVTITACSDGLITNTNPDTDIFYSNKITIEKILKIATDNEIDTKTIYLNDTKRFKNSELRHLEENIYSNRYIKYEQKNNNSILRNFAQGNLHLFLANNQYSEVEYVAKNILKLVRDEGYKYKDISVITKNIDTYSNLVRAIFNEYDIPTFIDEKRSLNQNIIVQYVLAIIEIFNKNYSYESVFNYIKTGLLEIDEEDIFKLENYCIKWGIKQSKWNKDFSYGIEENEAEVQRLNEIRKQIINPLVDLKQKIEQEKTAEKITRLLYQFLIDQNIEGTVKKKIELLEEKGLIDIANEYKASYDTVIEIFDEIVSIFQDEKLSFNKYVQILKTGLKNSGLGKIPGTQDQVIVGDVERSRSHKVKAIFIVGINDGVFPSVNKDEGFFNDKDREILKYDGIELAKGTIDKLYEDNFNIYKAFTTAEEKLYLSYASSDSEGKTLRPSTLISKVKKIFPDIQENSDIIEEQNEILTPKTTYEELIKQISKLEEKEIDDMWYNLYAYYKQEDVWKQLLKKDLQGLKYTNLPSKISKENIQKLYGNTLNTSISKLEKYRGCPFSYYLQYGLKLKEKEEPKIQSLNTGTFMHEVIDVFFTEVKGQKIDLSEIEDEQIEKIVEEIINEKLKLPRNYIFTATAKSKVLVIRLKRIIAKALKYIIKTITESRFEILGTELEFGDKGTYKPIRINLDDGKTIEITGKIDRIDMGKNEDGKYLRIIDYKSSAKNIDLNDVYAGLQIQLLTYMDAVCKVEDLMPAGILYFSLLEQMIKSDKRMTDEEIEDKIRANFKMKGLILADVNIVKMHDKNLESGASNLVPAYIDKSGNLSSSRTNGVTKEQFEILQDYIYKTIKDISKEILSGNIDLKPYNKAGKTPCEYCAYKVVCGFNSGFCKNEYNYIGKSSKEEMIEKMKNDISTRR